MLFTIRIHSIKFSSITYKIRPEHTTKQKDGASKHYFRNDHCTSWSICWTFQAKTPQHQRHCQTPPLQLGQLTRIMGSFVSRVLLRLGGSSSATAFAEDRLRRGTATATPGRAISCVCCNRTDESSLAPAVLCIRTATPLVEASAERLGMRDAIVLARLLMRLAIRDVVFIVVACMVCMG